MQIGVFAYFIWATVSAICALLSCSLPLCFVHMFCCTFYEQIKGMDGSLLKIELLGTFRHLLAHSVPLPLCASDLLSSLESRHGAMNILI